MEHFSVVLELKSQYQSGPKIGEFFTSKADVAFIALDEVDAHEMIRENFGDRMVAQQKYHLKNLGDAGNRPSSGFAITPL